MEASSTAATAAAPASAPSVAEQVSTTLGVATKILRAYHESAAADLAESKAAATNQARTIVVVGEVKRGKSSLVNALLGTRDASPMDVDVTTSATLHFVPASDEHPTGTVDLVYPGSTERVPHAELAEWVTASGAKVIDPQVQSLPTAAVIGAADVFDGAAVIDTPGTGGLNPAHAQLAARSAEQACVLVVTSDASSPLTAPEMAFIREASASVESLIVVVTKTDKNIRRWKAIVAEDKRLLREHLGRDIPVIGVSSVRALAAAEFPVGERRDRIENACGIVELRRQLRARLELGEWLPAVDGLRTAREGLRRVARTIDTDLAITRDSEAVLPDLTAERDRLQGLKDQSQQWEQYLGRDLTIARQSAMTHLDARLDEIRTHWTNHINKNGLEVLRRSPQVFTADIEADLLAAMASTMQVFLDEFGKVVMPLFESEVVWNDIARKVIAATHTDDGLTTADVASKRHNLLDPSVLTMGLMGTSALGALIGIGALAGVVWVGVNLGYRAMRAGKQNLLAWLRETLGVTRTSTARMLEAAMSTGRPELVVRYREHLRTSIDKIQQQITMAKDAARQDAESREKKLQRLTKNQRIVTARAGEIDALIAQLTAEART